MPARSFFTALLLLATIIGCSTSTHLVVGQTRPPTSPNEIMLFLNAPTKYETIALVTAEGKPSWAITSQQQMDVALGRLKDEAALVGANGILLQGMGDRYNGSLGSAVVTSRGFSTLAFSSGMPLFVKELKGIAIYVPPEATAAANGTDYAPRRVSYETTPPSLQTPAAQSMPPTVSGREVVISRDLRAWFGPGGQGQGLLVTEVDENGPAALAGIHVGDVITAVDGTATAPYRWENAAALITAGDGDTVRLVVLTKK